MWRPFKRGSLTWAGFTNDINKLIVKRWVSLIASNIRSKLLIEYNTLLGRDHGSVHPRIMHLKSQDSARSSCWAMHPSPAERTKVQLFKSSTQPSFLFLNGLLKKKKEVRLDARSNTWARREHAERSRVREHRFACARPQSCCAHVPFTLARKKLGLWIRRWSIVRPFCDNFKTYFIFQLCSSLLGGVKSISDLAVVRYILPSFVQ